MPDAPVQVGVIGLGFMGSTHVRCYQAAHAAGLPCRLVAVSDRDPAKLTGQAATAGNIATGAADRLFDPATVRAHADPLALIADPAVQAVSICTHTRTHVDLALAALRAGKHVLVEKPVALDAADAQRLADEAAKHQDLVCMPAMVMRFWPGWPLVREAIRDALAGRGQHGPLRSLVLTRRGSTPGWSSGFYGNLDQSGGALFDLHVHDADFILWSLGQPSSVVSTGDARHVTTIYRFAGGTPIHVVAEGGTDHDPAYGFHIRLTAAFDRGTIDFDLNRTPNLLLAAGGLATPIPAPPEGPFDHEVRAFIAACTSPTRPIPQPVPIADAVRVLHLLHAEKQSLEDRRELVISPHDGV